MQETAEGTAGATAAARKWVLDKGWVEDDYRFAMSQVQSAPLGFVSVDVMCIRHEDADDAAQLLQRSRVLELNTGTPAPRFWFVPCARARDAARRTRRCCLTGAGCCRNMAGGGCACRPRPCRYVRVRLQANHGAAQSSADSPFPQFCPLLWRPAVCYSPGKFPLSTCQSESPDPLLRRSAEAAAGSRARTR
jgi:hypothetical protein